MAGLRDTVRVTVVVFFFSQADLEFLNERLNNSLQDLRYQLLIISGNIYVYMVYNRAFCFLTICVR